MKYLKRVVVIFVLPLIGLSATPVAAALVPGRIAISSDGNRCDCDDLFSSAVAVAILAKTGNAKRLAYYGYADHVWSTSGGCADGNREDAMRRSTVDTATKYGGFNLANFINAKANQATAIQKLTDEINKSSSTNPLWIVAAGPMQVVGTALSRAASSHRQYVTLISHSSWNDNHSDRPESNEPTHSGWTWSEIGKMSAPPKMKHLPDQNDELRVSQSTFYEWRDSSSPLLRWLWARNKATGKSVADLSDAGMTYWLSTGRTNTTPSASQVKTLLR